MAKLDALKEKISGLKSKLEEKADKIAFLKAWREKRAAQKNTPEPEKPRDPLSLGEIYREGSTSTRFQVLGFYALILFSIYSGITFVKKLAQRFRSTDHAPQAKEEYAKNLHDVSRRVVENANMISLGQYTAAAFAKDSTKKLNFNMDIWVRVSDPEAADYVNGRINIFQDKISEALSSVSDEKIDILTEHGKQSARERVKAAVNATLPKGKTAEEIFIQNLVVQ